MSSRPTLARVWGSGVNKSVEGTLGIVGCESITLLWYQIMYFISMTLIQFQVTSFSYQVAVDAIPYKQNSDFWQFQVGMSLGFQLYHWIVKMSKHSRVGNSGIKKHTNIHETWNTHKHYLLSFRKRTESRFAHGDILKQLKL